MEKESLDSINTNKNIKMNFKPGDFSFIKVFKEVFEYDYRVVDKMGDIAWNTLKNWDNTQHTFTKNIINDNLYPGHTALTYRTSLNNLIFIANNGWDEFISINKK